MSEAASITLNYTQLQDLCGENHSSDLGANAIEQAAEEFRMIHDLILGGDGICNVEQIAWRASKRYDLLAAMVARHNAETKRKLASGSLREMVSAYAEDIEDPVQVANALLQLADTAGLNGARIWEMFYRLQGEGMAQSRTSASEAAPEVVHNV